MTAEEIVSASGLPWLELDVRFDHERALAEARAVSPRLVKHRSNGRGWRGLCLHGLGADKTLAASEYGFASDFVAPHTWTEVAERCPETVRFVKSLALRRLFRVRFMLVEPHGFVEPHADSTTRRLGPINAALSQPEGCLLKVEGHGVVPFTPGSAFLMDISNRHAVMNASREERFHLIIHGVHDESDPAWAALVERSYLKSQPARPPPNSFSISRIPGIRR